MDGYITSEMAQVIPASVPTWALLVQGDKVVAEPVVAWGLFEERLADEPAVVHRNVRALVISDDDSLYPAGVPMNFGGLVHSLEDLPNAAEVNEWIEEHRS